MTFLNRVLDPPHYGFARDGQLYVPTHGEIFREFLSRMNIFRSKKNWLPVFSWLASLSLALPLYFFVTHYFSFPLLIAAFFYSMVALGSHGTFWLHRYSTHRAFKFKNAFVRQLCRNVVVRIIPEEVYVVSHYVHHRFSEKPGDPYNVNGGWLYCFLADANHQGIRKDLSEKDYAQVCRLMAPSGIYMNSYKQYQRWGSVSNPFMSVLHYASNWAFWYGAFYFMGGHALATALLGSAAVWGIGVRTYNYDGHGAGKDRRVDGSDFNRKDLSVNQKWAGFVAGEWHNNHHLFPNGARSGFLSYQLDIPWIAIWSLNKLGLVSDIQDYKAEFMNNHFLPYLAGRSLSEAGVTVEQVKEVSAGPDFQEA